MVWILELIPSLGVAGIGLATFAAWSKARAIERWMTVYEGHLVVAYAVPARTRQDVSYASDLH